MSLLDKADAATKKEFEAFYEQHLKPLEKRLEVRRTRYRQRLALQGLLTLFLLLMWFWFSGPMYEWMANYEAARSPERGPKHDAIELMIMHIFVMLGLMVFAFYPIFRYRNHVRMYADKIIDETTYVNSEKGIKGYMINLLQGVLLGGNKMIGFVLNQFPNTRGVVTYNNVWEKVSLKKMLYGEIFKAYGDFAYRPKGMNAKVNLMHPMLLPPHDEYRSEDNISGPYKDMLLDIAECQLIKKVANKRKSIFKGLFITIDISDPNVKIRGWFRGRTAMIEKTKHDLAYIQQRFKNYDKVSLPSSEYNDQFDVWTTDPDESQIMLEGQLLNNLRKFGKLMQGVTLKGSRFDDKLWHFFTDPFSPKSMTIQDDAELTDAVYSINNNVQCSYYEDKVQITVPYKGNLFEPPSIFEPVMDKEEMFVIYKIMERVAAIIDNINESKKSLDKPYPDYN